MSAIYCEAFGFLITGYSPFSPENRATASTGMLTAADLRCHADDPRGHSEDTKRSQDEQPMPSRNLLRDIDELCLRNLTLAVERGERPQSELDAAFDAFALTYGERPTLPERPARQEAA